MDFSVHFAEFAGSSFTVDRFSYHFFICFRWFLGYTCCDACGRLFVKGNYCPVCLKVPFFTPPGMWMFSFL